MPDSKDSAPAAKQVLPYGTWPSTLNAEDVAAQSRRLAEPQICGSALYWLEARPQEKGRVQIIRRDASGALTDVLPENYSARSKVHEYGGGSYVATDNAVYFVNNEDQRIYQLTLAERQLVALTPPGELRFADLHVDQPRQRLLAVCEDHRDGHDGVANYLVAVPLDGSGTLTTLVEGDDFYASPRLSPDGNTLCWLSWNHPAMPWDATRLFIADLDAAGTPARVRCVAGDRGNDSIFQPQWSPRGDLMFVSDRDNWWNIYRIRATDLHQPAPTADSVTQLEAEFATPQWVFNMSTYGFLNSDTLLATYTREGRWQLTTIHLPSGAMTALASPLTQFSAIQCAQNQGILLGASPVQGDEVYAYRDANMVQITHPSAPLDPASVSAPIAVRFATTETAQAHAFFYPPHSTSFTGPADAKPPLIVIGHGGPTGATETSLNLKIQYWTSRGFAVLDVNYRGSTGYGRQYRQALYGHWGVRDVDDVCAATEYVTAQGWVHPQQRVIKGSSAGGYTVLAALTFRNTFNAGVSLYGIGDLELLARDTHKFEARYLDSLVGPYPAQRERYRALSPINHVRQLRCPLLVFQGLEDKVVPPNQAQAMVDAVAQQQIPVAYVTYADEGHGFRQAQNISHMLNAELDFYQRIFALGSTDREPVIDIINLENN